MFVILTNYIKPLAEVDSFIKVHRDYLENGYQKNYFLASGPKEPRTGGVILSQLKDKKVLESFLFHDPFYLNGIVDYEIVEFLPVKFHPKLKSLIDEET